MSQALIDHGIDRRLRHPGRVIVTDVLIAEGVGKRYIIGQLSTAYGSVRDSWERLWSRRESATEREFWALRDVSFRLAEGEVLGIIGRNGAGKSTLLKILTRITDPTEGSARVRGRVGALLEVGSGFHPELTGRENIRLNGAILGMTSKEIAARFDEIVAFAEIERFIDTPVKRYSSGMYVRLAFAVAAHLEPDVLVIDEVLAVGDASFQEKCLQKMGDASRGGRTALFVSHNLTAVEALCTRAILIDKGRLVCDGRPSDVIRTYMGEESILDGERTWPEESAPRSEMMVLRGLRVRRDDGVAAGTVACGSGFSVEFDYDVVEAGYRLGAILIVRTADGTPVFSSISNTDPDWHAVTRAVGRYRSRCSVPADLLAEGQYALSVIFWFDNYRMCLNEQNLIGFRVTGPSRARGDYMWRLDGVVRPVLQWETSLREAGEHGPDGTAR